MTRPRSEPTEVRRKTHRSVWPEIDLRPSRELVRIADGEYDARAFNANYKKSIGGERRLFIWFELIGGQTDGIQLFMACPIPRDQRPSPSSKFYQAWTIANGGRPPRRNDRMSLRIFENRLLRVRVVTVTTRYALVARKRAALAAGSPRPSWCFTTTAGTPLDESRVRKVMARALKAAGLPQHFSPHCLRHTFASLLLADGESPQWGQEQLGHSSLELTMRIYGRWLPKKPIMGGVARLDAPNGGKLGSKIIVLGAQGNIDAHIQSVDSPIPQKTAPCNWIRIGPPAAPAAPAPPRGGCS